MFPVPVCVGFRQNLSDEPVLVCGHGDIKRVAKSIGLNKAVTVEEYLAHNEFVYPPWNEFEKNFMKAALEKTEHEDISTPEIDMNNLKFKAVFVLHDSFFVMRDVQVIVDVLNSNGTPGEPSVSEQDVPLYMSNPDFLYANSYKEPRFGQGAFKVSLQAVFKEYTGKDLKVNQYGKPEKVVYEFAKRRLNQLAKDMGYDGISQVYCIGDNPKADIFGANQAGDDFVSVLVRTGVFNDSSLENDKDYPADFVMDSVSDFVLKEYLEKRHKK